MLGREGLGMGMGGLGREGFKEGNEGLGRGRA